jgi:hypothetical protein
MPSRFRTVLLAAVLVACAAPAARAQSAPAPDAEVRACPVVADTSRLIPTRPQLRERREMRDSLVAVARRHRVADPQGLLFVTVDSTRRGRALFLDSNLPAPAVQQATRQVEAYLHALQPGRNYQMLVRVGGREPSPAAGKEHCPPRLLNAAEVRSALNERLADRPRVETPHPDSVKRAVLRLVVNRDGGVSFVDLDQPSGDSLVDALLPEYAARLRFAPATLDGVPFDVRLRYRW